MKLRTLTILSGVRLLTCSALAVLMGCGSGVDTGGGVIDPGPSGGGVSVDEVDLAFVVANPEAVDRRETVCVSIPFPEGQVHSLEGFAVAGHPTAWLPLQRWVDGSIRVAQAQFVTSLDSNTDLTLRVERGGTVLSEPFRPHPWVDARRSELRIGARVHDTFGHRYESEISGDGEVLQETALKRVRRWRTYHESVSSGGIGRDYLASTFYVSEFRDAPFLIVDWIVGSDYGGKDDPEGSTDPNDYPLGPVDVNDLGFLVAGAADAVAYRPGWHDIEAPTSGGSGRQFFRVMEEDWFGDGQTKRYRFLLSVEDPGASASELTTWRERFVGFHNGPPASLVVREAWALCEALGLLGGPLAGPSDAAERADQDWNRWLGHSEYFGRWGSFGDVTYSNQPGTPRNAPLGPELAHAVQSGDLRLLTILEQKTWAQANRPYHAWGLTVGANEAILLWDGLMSLDNRWARDFGGETLGRRALRANDPWSSYRTRVETDGKPHEWNPYDFQHWTTDLHFEHWTITGDEWAREELRLLGQCLKGVARMLPEYVYAARLTSIRAEAWAMQSWVQVYLATGDDSIRAYALRRAAEVVDRDRLRDHPSRAMGWGDQDPRSGLPTTSTSNYTWFAPWQMAFMVFGYAAGHKFFDSELCLEIAQDSIRSIDYASVSNYTNPVTNEFVEWGLRYGCVLEVDGVLVPADYFDNDPGFGIHFSGSTARPTVSAAAIMADVSPDPVISAMAAFQSRMVMPELNENDRWDKWVYTLSEPAPVEPVTAAN